VASIPTIGMGFIFDLPPSCVSLFHRCFSSANARFVALSSLFGC